MDKEYTMKQDKGMENPTHQGKKIEDMESFDSKEILKTIDTVNELGKNSYEKLIEPFVKAVPSMVLSSADMHKSIGNQINSVQQEALKNFNKVFDSLKNYTEDIQKMQSKEKPSDFNKKPIDDLRPKIATGFPLEDPLFFKDLPKIKT